MLRIKDGPPHEELNLQSAVLKFTATGTSNLADAFSAYLSYTDCVCLTKLWKSLHLRYAVATDSESLKRRPD